MINMFKAQERPAYIMDLLQPGVAANMGKRRDTESHEDVPSLEPCPRDEAKAEAGRQKPRTQSHFSTLLPRQLWYADDGNGIGAFKSTIAWATLAKTKGVKYGYYINTIKSVIIVQPGDEERVRTLLLDTPFADAEIRTGTAFVGGYVGDAQGQKEYIDSKAKEWVRALKQMVDIGCESPHQLFAAYTCSFQHKWTYVQRTVQANGSSYEPVEKVIKEDLLPAVTKWLEVSPDERQLLGLPVRAGGLGIVDPTEKAKSNYAVSRKATEHLVAALLGEEKWNARIHHKTFTSATSDHKAVCNAQYTKLAKEFAGDNSRVEPAMRRAVGRASEYPTGHFLTVKPTKASGTTLRPCEFWDGINVRYGKKPPDIPTRCPNCQEDKAFSLGHALTCKKGGAVVGRHDIISASLATIGRMALTTSKVSTESWIRKRVIREDREIDEGLKADVRMVGLGGDKEPAAITDIDVRCFYPDAPTYSNANMRTEKMMKTHSEEKLKKYKAECDKQGLYFIPFIATTDGTLGEDAERVVTMLGARLADKWRKTRGEVMGWIRARISLAIVRASSACIRGFQRGETKEKALAREQAIGFDDGAALARLFRRQEDRGRAGP